MSLKEYLLMIELSKFNIGIYGIYIPVVDERCDMELDETDPAVWLKLEAAIEEYIQNNSQAFKNACERLALPFLNDERLSENLKSQYFSKGKVSNTGVFLLYRLLYFLRI